MIFTNRPSIISEGQAADEFHHFTIIYFPPLALGWVFNRKWSSLVCGGVFFSCLESVLHVLTRMDSGGEQSIMIGSSSLQRVMKVNPHGTQAALQMVPDPLVVQRPFEAESKAKLFQFIKGKSLQGG